MGNKVLQANTQDLLDAWEDMSNSDKQRVALALRRTPVAAVLAQVPSAYEVSMQQRAVSVEQALAEKGNSVDNTTKKKGQKATNATSLQQRASVLSVEQALAAKGNNTDKTATGKKKSTNSTSLQQRASSVDAALANKGEKTDGATKKKGNKKTEANATESENATQLLQTFTASPASSFEAFALLEKSDKTALINKVLQANTQDLLDAWEDMSNSDKQRVALALRRTPVATVLAQVPSAYAVSMQQRAVSVEQALAEKGKSVDNTASGKKNKANATSLQQRASVMSVEQALSEKGNKTDSATKGKGKNKANTTLISKH